ncbi:bifunctional 3-phenylpropionate/cinnamic acid dioxygenase ferredoxin subunit [Rhodoferax ferrireducens]|uniref:bifunctional 3-phenylpropionate/cinnamic acid dioxygenase ferredoxin subunit n=1 Tax=Rhodoferax ferrireducens TaxID=192843 RepID=UPI000E0CDA92|nr:bifunctional 3-phenylpropionate/cinnamic acid dioxygenase ferredoxin subunit [Rhodoferax ferrireducens]
MEQKDVTLLAGELRLCRVDAVEDGEALRVEVEGRMPLAVYHVDGEFYVTDDTCSHGNASLSEGTVENGQVECPWHVGRFCLKTGSALTFPAVTPIRAYRTIVKDGAVFIHPEDSSS